LSKKAQETFTAENVKLFNDIGHLTRITISANNFSFALLGLNKWGTGCYLDIQEWITNLQGL
jgi:hypothetical protein